LLRSPYTFHLSKTKPIFSNYNNNLVQYIKVSTVIFNILMCHQEFSGDISKMLYERTNATIQLHDYQFIRQPVEKWSPKLDTKSCFS
jgi:hypothetical protein